MTLRKDKTKLLQFKWQSFHFLFVLVLGVFVCLLLKVICTHERLKVSCHCTIPFLRIHWCFFFSVFSWLHFKDSGKSNKIRSKTNIASHCFISKDSITEQKYKKRGYFFMDCFVHVTCLYLNLQSGKGGSKSQYTIKLHSKLKRITIKK